MFLIVNMSDHTSIVSDPYNPIIIDETSVKFPHWLSDRTWMHDSFPRQLNWSFIDHAVQLHASFYDATVWYPLLESFTPESVLIPLNDDEIKTLIYEQRLSDEKRSLVMSYIRSGYNFVKSSKKSSHFRIKVKNYEQFIEEITHPQVIMSFKNGCKHIFMRRYIDNMTDEYRVYVYRSKLRYVERYIAKSDNALGDAMKTRIVEYIDVASPHITYEDYVLDIALLSDGQLMCIEINTPLYLFAGLQHADYTFERDKIHDAIEPIFRW